MAENYTCANCGGTFEKTYSDEEAMAEMESNFSPEEIAAEGKAIVCDDCYKRFMTWMKASPHARAN
jgi:DNA-directed RNA polymerase subunit RPC12/RpoP